MSDQRTGLDLSSDGQICFDDDIELSFDLSFVPNRSDYFGYVVRIIVNDQTNIDLLYDRLDNVEKHFKIVMGEKFSNIAFNIDSNTLFNEWVPITIKLDAQSKQVIVTCGDKVFHEQLTIDPRGCVKVLFGYNNYKEFKTTDVPAMKIRDIQVRQGDRLAHHWPLDEEEGTEIDDAVKGMTAMVRNPQWIRRSHYEWGLLQDITVGGRASAAFDPQTESVFIVGRDSLLRIHVPTGQRHVFKYASGPLLLVNGNQSFFDTAHNQLLNICIDQRIVSVFDFASLSWSENFNYPGVGTSYLHFNKFYSPADSSLYFIGGYGHFLFKNEIHRYSLNGTWHNIEATGDPLIPRYLAALGATPNGAYIIGGYGSVSGQQMLNPRNLYDLQFFDVKSRTFSKKYELEPGEDDFVWANSLVIDEATNQYYGLIFPKHQYNANLQLVAGSLTQPELKKLGGAIPYLFHDIRSFSDLYYCPDSKRFAAVTLYYDDIDVTTAKIYSLYSPPLPYNTAKNSPQNEWLTRNMAYLGLGLGVVVLVGLYVLRRKKDPKDTAPPIDSQSPIVRPKEEQMRSSAPIEKQQYKSSIFLFGGDLQLFDTGGTDITRSFTPLIKELFLVVLLHTIRWGRGISSEKLTEQFWFDKSTESARNNRSVNIAKINTILERMGRAKISKETGYWRFDADDDIYIDYKNYLAIVTNKDALDKERIKELSVIVQRGGFLSETDYEWLDSFKAEASIQVINTYMRFAESVQIAEDPEFMVELANYIFYFDPVHEEAMTIKCKALAYMGNHSLATQTFENFCNEYRQIYGEEFGKDYKKVLS
ncbi:Kelch repeat-containing protein [Parapedobacter koreensis]|uniref:galactose oxidase n=1 Tax=Parapedobacter koreensis TaxID=332977 RepID=UPI0015A54A5C|nr:galactose oxidase [Parapedobacter koreensis]